MREIRTSGSVGASGSNLRGDPTPPPQLRSILRKRQEAWDGEESEGELFEQIRREYEFGIGTVKGVARKLCSRAMLDDAQGAACIAIEAGESPPVLADQYWVETPVMITRNRKLKLAG